jgi:uncharacterized protein YprB with RNaseH-like and TPR domain
MSLKSRLAMLQKQVHAGTQVAEASPSPATTARRLARLQPSRFIDTHRPRPPRVSDTVLAEQLNGEIIGNGAIRIVRRKPLNSRHGNIVLEKLRQIAPLPGEADEPLLSQAYIDTETTGLSGGSGTVAFLIGMATIDGHELKITQWLMTRFSAEATILQAFGNALETGHRLVSYNGKSFDLPLLLTRYRMQGIPPSFAGHSHLDLLHPVRRLFGKRWPDCRLTTVEKQLLRFERHNDLPGAEAPQAWFDYLKRGNAGRLLRVVEHNYLDIVSLAATHTAIAATISDPTCQTVDISALAQWYSINDRNRALTILESGRDRLDDKGLQLLARLYQQSGRQKEAVRIWENLADKGCQTSLEHLAKYFEHQVRDYAKALAYCDRLDTTERSLYRRQRIVRKGRDFLQRKLPGEHQMKA